MIDTDPAGDADAVAGQLLQELAAGTADDQVAYRGGQRLAARPAPSARSACGRRIVGHAGAGCRIPAAGPFRLRLGTAGQLRCLARTNPSPAESPGPGQVEVQVHATGLNFSDVLKAMGLYPGITDEIVPLGIECAGVVTAVGTGVERFRVGDAVMGVVPYSLASHALTAEYALVAKPEPLSDAEAATIPITFLTAYYGLVRLAQLQRGERVLIHAAAGGVGLAAIQIAQQIGAEVFATAGSDPKAGLPAFPGRPARVQFPNARLCRPDHGGDATPRRRRRAELAARRRDQQEPLDLASLRTVSGDRQDGHLSEPHDRPAAVPGQSLVLCHRLGSLAAPAAGDRARACSPK